MELSDSQQCFPARFFATGGLVAAIMLIVAASTVLVAEQKSGDRLTDSFVNNARFGGGQSERTMKTDLLAKTGKLDFVLLGNSRVQRWDPQRITNKTKKHGFNAGLVGVPIRDTRAIVDWLAQRAKNRNEEMPHLIYVLPFESFHEQPKGASSLELPGPTPTRSTFERITNSVERTKALTQWHTFKRASQVLLGRDTKSQRPPRPIANKMARPPIQPGPLDSSSSNRPARRQGPAIPSAVPAQTQTQTQTRTPSSSPPPTAQSPTSSSSNQDPLLAAPDEQFRADGYLPAGAFFSASRFGEKDNLRAFVTSQHRNFYADVIRRGGPGRIEPSALAELTRIFTTANKAGDTPTIVLPPLAADFARELEQMRRETFANTVRAWLKSAAKQHEIVVLDYSDPSEFGEAQASFYDGVHPRSEITNAMIDRLLKDDPKLR